MHHFDITDNSAIDLPQSRVSIANNIVLLLCIVSRYIVKVFKGCCYYVNAFCFSYMIQLIYYNDTCNSKFKMCFVLYKM